MKALGLTCGVGSMLIGAKKAGFKVVGNIEWRPYYKTGTFQKNFPGAFMVKSMADLDEFPKDIDLAMGHPECGMFSNLCNDKSIVGTSAMDIPLFVKMIRAVKPRFVVMDDLPKAFIPLPPKWWVEQLPAYDLFFEWISNWGYGNLQINRKRLFLIAALKDEKFVFIPHEQTNPRTVASELGDLLPKSSYGKFLNHHPHVLDVHCSRAKHMGKRNKEWDWRHVAEYFAKKEPGGSLEYIAGDGQTKTRFGLLKTKWDGPANVLTGSNPIIHPIKNLPLSVRERARIQGCPDDFEFVGEVVDDKGFWNHERNNYMVKQTGKFMPVQFCEYVANLIMGHIRKEKPLESLAPNRILPPNPYVDEAKQQICWLSPYSNQKATCFYCWMKDDCGIQQVKSTGIKRRK